MNVDEVRRHIRYSGWASRRLMDAARQLSPEERDRPTGISHESIAGTLSHIHFADRIWYSRLIDPNEPVLVKVDFATLEKSWPEIQQKWEAWVESVSEADLDRVIIYKNPDATHSTIASHVVLHLINHATLHRGQVMGMIRQLGVRPPATDFMFHLREVGESPKVA